MQVGFGLAYVILQLLRLRKKDQRERPSDTLHVIDCLSKPITEGCKEIGKYVWLWECFIGIERIKVIP